MNIYEEFDAMTSNMHRDIAHAKSMSHTEEYINDIAIEYLAKIIHKVAQKEDVLSAINDILQNDYGYRIVCKEV